MELILSREELLRSLELVSGPVEKRQTLAILSHVYMQVKPTELSLITTDGEVELVSRVSLNQRHSHFETTLPARKLLDICKVLPEEAMVNLNLEDSQGIIKSGRTRFTLASLPAREFPRLETSPGQLEFSLQQKILKGLITNTYFSMADQDVRYYLNGLLLEVRGRELRAVATDGHRLALMEECLPYSVVEGEEAKQIIIPRKSAMEIMRLLGVGDEVVTVTLGDNCLILDAEGFTFTSKLIDGRYPGYQRVIPSEIGQTLVCSREDLKQVLTRVSILSNDKQRSVRLQLRRGMLRAVAGNPDQEEASDEMEIFYDQGELDVGFNVAYLFDVLNTLTSPQVKMSFSSSDSSVLIKAADRENQQYVIMPMRM